jgi:hypothetical protein
MDYLTEHDEQILDAVKLDLAYGFTRSLYNMVNRLQGQLVARDHTIIALQARLDAFTLSAVVAEQFTEIDHSVNAPFDVNRDGFTEHNSQGG